MSTPVSRLALSSRAAVLIGEVSHGACGTSGEESVVDSAADAAATLRRFCVDCHNDAEFSGELTVTDLDPAAIHDDPDVWERIVKKLRTRTMPPPDAARPDDTTYATFANWLESSLDASAQTNPGAPALRRLNRAEYANAIRDLLDLEVDVAALLPPDDSAFGFGFGFGFDNIGDLLVFSPTLLERYLAAADLISALAVGDPATTAGATTYMVPGDQSQAAHLDGLPLGPVAGSSPRRTAAGNCRRDCGRARVSARLRV